MRRKMDLGTMAALALALLGACAADDGAVTPDFDEDAPALAQAVATRGGARNTPVELNDPDLKCYKLTAYAAAANKAQKYNAPTTPLLRRLQLPPPCPGAVLSRCRQAIVDNKASSSLRLYRSQRGTRASVATGSHPDAELLYAWAPAPRPCSTRRRMATEPLCFQRSCTTQRTVSLARRLGR